MPISVGDSTEESAAGTQSVTTITLRDADTDRILLVGCCGRSSTGMLSVELSGGGLGAPVALTHHRTDILSGPRHTSIYYALDADLPPAGTYTLTSTYNASVSNGGSCAVELNGAEQAEPDESVYQYLAGVSANSVSVAAEAGSVVWGVANAQDGITAVDESTGQTPLGETAWGGGRFHAHSYESFVAAGTEAFGYTTTGTCSFFGVTAVLVRESSQVHSLAPSDLTVAPQLDSPPLGQVHSLGVDYVSATPELDSPGLTESNALGADDLSAGAPELDAPALGQIHALAPSDLTVAPALDSPPLGQAHSLGTGDLTVTPVLDEPALSVGAHGLSPGDIASGSPELDAPDLGQVHGLAGSDLATQAPGLGSPPLGQVHALSANDLVVSPLLNAPALAQAHALGTSDISVSPGLESPALGQIHSLGANDLATEPALDSPTLGTDGVHAIEPDDLATSPALDSPVLWQVHSLAPNDLDVAILIDSPSLGQEHSLGGSDVVAGGPLIGSPALGQAHALTGSDLSAAPALDTPELGIGSHALSPSDLVVAPVLEVAPLGQVHALSPSDLSVTPLLGQVGLGGSEIICRLTSVHTSGVSLASSHAAGVSLFNSWSSSQ